MNPHLQRARMLVGQRRFEQAEQEIGRSLGEDPDDGYAHALAAYCLSSRDRYDAALDRIKQGIALEPNNGEVRLLAAWVALDRNDLKGAEEHASAAIAMAPHDPRGYVARASSLAQRKRWGDCEADARNALAIDPDDTDALNLIALCDRGLGRKAQRHDSHQAALRSDPENAFTHANVGWSRLQEGDTAAAEEHFREALRLDPSLDTARVGVLETTKAKFFAYRWFLRMMMQLDRLPAGVQLGLVLGLWFGMRVLGALGDKYPALQPFILPIALAYLAFCIATWAWRPISNAALFLHPFARLALTREEKTASAVALGAAGVNVALLLAAVVSLSEPLFVLWLSSFGPLLATVFALQMAHPKPARILHLVAIGLWVNVAVVLGVHYGGDAVQQHLSEGAMAFINDVLNPIRRLSAIGVIIGSQVLAAQHWQKARSRLTT